MRILLLLLALSTLALAQAKKFEDVHVWVSNNPADEGKRQDGILNFVPDAKCLVTLMNAKDHVAHVIPYASITRVTYNPGAGKELRIYFQNPDGAPRSARLRLHGGNWDEILQEMNAVGIKLETIAK